MTDRGGLPLGSVVPELVVLGGAVCVLLYALFTPLRLQRYAPWLAQSTLVVAAATTVPMLGGRQELTFFDTYATDDAALWAKLGMLAVTSLAVALSSEWFRTDRRHGDYYAILLFATLGALLLAGAADLMELVLAVLLSSATGYVLAAYHRAEPKAAEAGIKYFLLGAITNSSMLYGVVLLFGLAGSTTLLELSVRVEASSPALLAGAALVLLGLVFKLGAVPAHPWVPDIADGAPTPVAAFLTAVPKIGALVAVARLVVALPDGAVGWRAVIAGLAAATMTLGNLAALWQEDVRRLLGWSAVSQSGYALVAVVAIGRTDLALPGLLFFIVAYAVGNLAAFGVVVELRGAARLGDYRGLATRHPLLAAALLLAFLSFVGVPPLAGFTGKLVVFAAAIDAGYAWLAVLGIVNSVVSLFYYLRVIVPAYLDTGETAPALLGRSAAGATIVAAAALVVLGVGAEPLLDAFASAALRPG